MKLKNKIVYVSFIIVTIAFSTVLSIYYFRNKNQSDNANQEKAEETTLAEIISKGSKVHPIMLEGHDNSDDCWIGYIGLVFDLTGLLPVEGISEEDCGKIISRDLTVDTVNKIYPYYIATLNDE